MNNDELMKWVATSAAETPFIGTVLVTLLKRSVITRSYSLRLFVLIDSLKMSIHTDVSGDLAGNSCNFLTFFQKFDIVSFVLCTFAYGFKAFYS